VGNFMCGRDNFSKLAELSHKTEEIGGRNFNAR
jgi:hypothetical protein